MPLNKGGVIDPIQERYLLPREVAAIFRVAPDAIHAWIRAGRLHAVNVGAGRPRYLVPESEVQRLLGTAEIAGDTPAGAGEPS